MRKIQKNKWLSVGNDELSAGENRVEIGYGSEGNPSNSLPIDENGKLSIDFETKAVIGPDDSEKVKVMGFPYNTIALLRIECDDGHHIGTGFFISPRCIATAGHCVFKDGKWAKSVTVVPGASLGDFPKRWGETTAIKFRSVEGWVKYSDIEYDYGAIILSDNLLFQKLCGYMGYAEYHSELASEVELVGYPDGKGEKQFFTKGFINREEGNLLYYTLDTEPGQSGSPVFVRDTDNKCIVVGVHRGTNNVQTENHAIRVNNSVMCRWQEWSDL
jgi:V8-like Glu-specific endopeptidase